MGGRRDTGSEKDACYLIYNIWATGLSGKNNLFWSLKYQEQIFENSCFKVVFLKKLKFSRQSPIEKCW